MAPRRSRAPVEEESDSSVELSGGLEVDGLSGEEGEKDSPLGGDSADSDTAPTPRRSSRSRLPADVEDDAEPAGPHMKLHLMEIENFKSYRGKQTIGPFKHNFQAVIGPNGSGKSNIMDAISFVLGVRSRDLRSETLTQLIYRPAMDSESQGDSESLSPALGAQRDARVSLVFAATDGSEEECSFSRSISAGGDSKYAVNGRTHSFKEFAKQLHARCGVDVHAQNFLVFQGHVSNPKTPKEISELIDIVSGSRALAQDYEEKKAAMQEADEGTRGSFLKRKEMQQERSHYKGQKQEAERYVELQGELEQVSQDKVLLDLLAGEERMAAASTKIDELNGQLLSLQKTEGKKLKADRKAAQKSRAQHVLSHKKQEQSIRTAKSKADAGAIAVSKLQKEESQLKSRVKTTKTSLTKIEKEAAGQTATVKKLKTELQAAEKAQADFDKGQKKRRASGVQLDQQQMHEYTQLKQEVFSKSAAVQAKLEANKRSVTSNHESLKSYEAKLADLEQVEERKEGEKNAYAKREKGLLGVIDASKKQKAAAERELEQVKRLAEQNADEQEQLTEELVELDTQLAEGRARKRETERQRRVKQAIKSLKQKFSGVRGSLLELCDPRQPKYHEAMTVAIGASMMDAVVVDTAKVGRECVQYLKQSRLISMTFLPLDTLRVKEFPIALREMCERAGPRSSARPAMDVLDFDPAIEKAVSYACRDTIVCDTIDEARNLVYKTTGVKVRRVVTINGAVVQKALMTGGIGGDSSSAAARWDEKRLDQLESRKEDVIQALVALSQSLRAGEKERTLPVTIRGLADRIERAEADVKDAQQRVTTATASLKETQKQVKDLKASIAKVKTDAQALEKTAKDLELEIAQVSDQVFSSFCAAVKVDNIREFESTHLEQAQSDAQKLSEIQTSRAKIEQQLQYETDRDLQTPLQNMKDTMADVEGKLKAVQANLIKKKKDDDAAQQKIEEQQKELEKLEAAIKEADSMLQNADKALKAHTLREGELKKSITAEESELEKLRSQRHSLREKCEVDDIVLPKKGTAARGDSVGFDSQQATQADTQQLEEVFDREADWIETIDMSRVRKMRSDYDRRKSKSAADVDGKRPKRGAAKASDTENEAEDKFAFFVEKHRELDARLNSISDTLSRMEPNMKAVEQFGDVSVRYDDTNAAFEDARAQSTAATKAFGRVKEQRQKLFKDALRNIEDNVGRVYQEITQSTQAAAFLTSENQEEPYLDGIEFRAIPPTKRFHGPAVLSGGEQTLATLALLFAVYAYKPSPFFVLDEIDAHLDAPNVEHVVKFIRARSRARDSKAEAQRETSQFVVITLNERVAQASDAMVGVYKNMDEGGASSTLTLDLTPFEQARDDRA